MSYENRLMVEVSGFAYNKHASAIEGALGNLGFDIVDSLPEGADGGTGLITTNNVADVELWGDAEEIAIKVAEACGFDPNTEIEIKEFSHYGSSSRTAAEFKAKSEIKIHRS